MLTILEVGAQATERHVEGHQRKTDERVLGSCLQPALGVDTRGMAPIRSAMCRQISNHADVLALSQQRKWPLKGIFPDISDSLFEPYSPLSCRLSLVNSSDS